MSSLKPAVHSQAQKAIFDRIVLGEAICKGVFYSKPGKQAIHSNMS